MNGGRALHGVAKLMANGEVGEETETMSRSFHTCRLQPIAGFATGVTRRPLASQELKAHNLNSKANDANGLITWWIFTAPRMMSVGSARRR